MQETQQTESAESESIPGSGRSPEGGQGNPLQYSSLENPIDRGVWQATVHSITNSWTQLKWLSTHTCTCLCMNQHTGWHLFQEMGMVQVGCMRQVLGPGALGKPRGNGWRGRWEGGLAWGTHVNPWLFHFNVWQNPPQIKKKWLKKKRNGDGGEGKVSE